MLDVSIDFERGLRTLVASAAFGNLPSLEAIDLVFGRSAFASSHPLIEILYHLALKGAGRTVPPLIPRIIPIPVDEMCWLVRLWKEVGYEEAAFSLASVIPGHFPWLWSKEGEYDEQQTRAALEWVENYRNNSSIHLSGSSSSFFQVHGIELIEKHIGGMQVCLNFSGLGAQLGCVVFGETQIRAFGPQTFPLSDPCGFGIRPIFSNLGHWASSISLPEAWFEIKHESFVATWSIQGSFYGVKPSRPLSFSFYVKASEACVGQEIFKPKTLHRYSGPPRAVRFGPLLLEPVGTGKMELIPLAGTGGYWGCDFLVSFEVHSIYSKPRFNIISNYLN